MKGFGCGYAALWIFGIAVAGFLDLWFFPLFLCGAIVGSLGEYAASYGSDIPCIGASGAIAAVIGVYFVLFPRSRLKCFEFSLYFWGEYTISALLFVILLFLAQLYGILSQRAGYDLDIGFGAHMGGLLFGVTVGLFVRGKPYVPPPPKIAPAVRDVESDNADSAIDDYIEDLGKDSSFILPAKAQLRLAEILTSRGLTVLSKTALVAYTQRYGSDSDVGQAHYLLGKLAWIPTAGPRLTP